MLLLKITTPDDSIFHLAANSSGVEALDGVDLVFWEGGKIAGVDPIQQKTSKDYGGVVRSTGIGGIKLTPDATFFPPPLKISVEANYFSNVNKSISNLFTMVGYLTSIKPDEIEYGLYGIEIDVNVLDDDESTYGTDQDRVLPMVIGTVSLELAMRVGTVSDYTYWKANIQGTDPSITGGTYDVHEEGSGQQKDKYVGGGDGTIVDQTTTFKSVLAADGTTANEPYGNVRISGTGSVTTLLELVTWAVARINTELTETYTVSSTYARSPSPSINYYVTEQQNIIDFLDDICSFFTHYLYIDDVNKIFYLGDMFASAGTQSLSDSYGDTTTFFSAEYNYPTPLKELTANWEGMSITTIDDDPVVEERSYDQKVYCPNLFGQEITIEPVYSNIRSEIADALILIGTIIQAPTSSVKIPFSIDAIPGKAYSWVDSKMLKDSSVTIRARRLQYDPINEEVLIFGQAFA